MSQNLSVSFLSPAIILEKSSEITLQIQQCSDLESLLQGAIAAIRALLQTDRVLIDRCLTEHTGFVAFESVGAEWTPLLGNAINVSCVDAVGSSRYPQGPPPAIAVVHRDTVDPLVAEHPEQFQVKASLRVPLLSQGSLWGWLIAHHCRRSHEWQPLEVQLLQHFALQLGVAIHQADLRAYQQHAKGQLALDRVDRSELKQAELALQWQSDQRYLLAKITQDIRQTLDLDHILHTTVTEVRQLLQTDRVIIYQFALDWSGTIIAESLADGWRSILGMQIVDTYFVGNQGQPYEQGRVAATNDIYTANLAPCHVAMLEQLQVRAKLVVPILQDDRLWGLLVAQHCRAPRTWEALEIALQQQLATQIAIAIQQAELHRQVQTLNANLELQVQERTAQLQQALAFEALLKRITDRVRDSLDEDEILQKVVQELSQALQADCCDTTVYSSDRTTAIVKYEYNQDGFTAQQLVCTIADSSDPNLFLQLFQGEYAHFCLLGRNTLRPGQPRKVILACPMMDDQGVLGDLWLFKSCGERFDEPEIRLVQQVANQCAIALRQSRLYQAAQSQVQALERLNQLKDDFLSTVSHELRTPMSSIKMATQLLELTLQPLGVLDDSTNAINRYVKILREEGQRELSLINDLLDLTQLEAGTAPLRLTTIALPLYIPHLVASFSDRIQQQQQQLVIHIPDHLPNFTTDLPYLERILTELLNNACKYTPAGATIGVAAHTTAETLEIHVSNSGVEIPAVECDRIFDKFYRIPNHDPWKHGGTGLGLALVKKLTERLCGQIHVVSSAGQTTFVLVFKFAELEAQGNGFQTNGGCSNAISGADLA